MQGFKDNGGGGWLQGKALECWCHFAANWKGMVEDSDFFILFEKDRGSTEEMAIRRFQRHFSLRDLVDEEVVMDLEDMETGTELSLPRGGVLRALQRLWNCDGLRDECRRMLLEWAEEIGKRCRSKQGRRDATKARFEEVCRLLRLGEVEREVLAYAMVRHLTSFDDFPAVNFDPAERLVFFAMAADCPASAVEKALSPPGALRKYEVLDADGDLCSGEFRRYLAGVGDESLEWRFYRKRGTEEALPWEYYGALAREHGAILKRLLRAADGHGGANVLFHGAPGTGKTSFAETLARELGLSLYEIRQGDRNGEHVSAQSRLAGIRICNGQVPCPGSMMLVDEADQLLETNRSWLHGEMGCGGRKGAINPLLDDTRLPTIWICNAPAEAIDESVRRRFDYSVHFPRLSERQRRAVWRNTVRKFGLEGRLGEERIEAYARKYRTSAGGIAKVLGNVRRMHPRKEETDALVERLMRPHCKLMGAVGGEESGVARLAREYSLEGLAIGGDVPLERIVAAVRRFREEISDGGENSADAPRMNLLLHGPPGTGKTELVKYLARAVDAPLSVRMGSDLLSMWVGGTEQNIREAFEEAEAEDAILFLDEIDGLVQDRRGASQNWEVTKVNELLHRMENFRGVMVGATNFFENLDAAVLRRFTFKLSFGYLDDAGKRLFFGRMFGTPLSPEETARLDRIANLSPGDFRTVRQSLHYLGGEATNEMRLGELEREAALKKGAPRRIGF